MLNYFLLYDNEKKIYSVGVWSRKGKGASQCCRLHDYDFVGITNPYPSSPSLFTSEIYKSASPRKVNILPYTPLNAWHGSLKKAWDCSGESGLGTSRKKSTCTKFSLYQKSHYNFTNTSLLYPHKLQCYPNSNTWASTWLPRPCSNR